MIFSGQKFQRDLLRLMVTIGICNPLSNYRKGLVVGAYTTSSLAVNVSNSFTVEPNWTVDAQNGSIAAGFFTNAGIPAACDALSHWGFQGSLYPYTGECLSTRKNILRSIDF